MNYEHLNEVIRRYASIQPLGLLSAGQIQQDLLAISGDRHAHRRSIGSDECLLCGRDLREEIHIRVEAA